MQALQFWKTVTKDASGVLDDIVRILSERRTDYCVIGGQAVNAYAEPVVSLDLDLVVATDEIEGLERVARATFEVERFEHSLNLSRLGSDLRVQFQRDPRYEAFLSRASPQVVLGLQLPVACAADVLMGKVWAAQDPTRRASKRQKDLADIARLIESRPELRPLVPEDVLARLI